MCDRLKINAWEIIDAASTKPFGFMPFYPGPGLGGHCIPIDPHYLSWKLKSLNYYSRFIELAGDINSHMPEYVFERVTRLLNKHQKPIKGAGSVLNWPINVTSPICANLRRLTAFDCSEAKPGASSDLMPVIQDGRGEKDMRSVTLAPTLLNQLISLWC
jgi:hypothetical protein